VKSVLSLLFAFGCERRFLASNPAAGIKGIRRKRGLPDANPPWSDEARHIVLDRLPSHMRAPIGLMMFYRPRSQGRAVAAEEDGEIATRRSKTDEAVFWQCPTELTAVLAAAPKHDAITLCANSRGRPWTESGFNSSWQKFRRQLEGEGVLGPGLTLYGLRHTVAVILREMGYDERTIADALGQAEPKMALHYAKMADLKPRCAAWSPGSTSNWTNGKQKLSNLPVESVKPRKGQ
jgi:integrase